MIPKWANLILMSVFFSGGVFFNLFPSPEIRHRDQNLKMKSAFSMESILHVIPKSADQVSMLRFVMIGRCGARAKRKCFEVGNSTYQCFYQSIMNQSHL